MEKIRRSILMGGGKTLLLGFALIVIALAATGCEQPDKGPVAVDSITISSELQTTDIEFEEGRTFMLTADIQPDNATDKTVVWSSSDETVATVSDDGTVTIKGVGNVTIKAEAGGKSASDTFVFYKGEDPGYYFNETENIYYIWDEEGLLAWNAYVTTHTITTTALEYPNIGTSAKLMADISLDGKIWTPVGSIGVAEGKLEEYYYAGTFDGGGHTISNLKIESSDGSDLGLFAYIATDGLVKDLTLSDVEISGVNYIGGIAGRNNGTIENCSVSGSVSGTYRVGGIAGVNYGTIKACYNTGNVSGTVAESIGGIVGYNRGTIENCSVSGSVSGTYAVSGIVGYNDGTISTCNNKGKVSGTEAECVGGIAGRNDGTISACYNIGEISGTDSVGGIAGCNYGTIENCSVSGSVSGIFNVGGIAGYNGGTISGCNNKGKVSGTEAEYVGGIAGFSYGTISACYNIGEILGYEEVGGIAGGNDSGLSDGIIISCYNTGNISGTSHVGGIAGYNYSTITACYWSVPEGSSITGIGDGSGSTTQVGENSVTWEAATSAMNDSISDWNKENSNKCDYQFVQNDGESEPPALEKGAPATT